MRATTFAAVALACSHTLSAAAADDTDAGAVELPSLTVLGSPEPRTELQTPAAVGVVDATVLHSAQPQIDLSETLERIPGIDVRDRQNDAQDIQIQSRGYGARATFGVRGIQIRADGIPLTAPDGQSQTSNLLISGLERVEVLRGPMAYQYGNSAGGVIAAYGAEPPPRPRLEASFGGGDYDTQRASLGAAGQSFDERLGYRVDVARYDSDGYREHSEARRNLASLNASVELGNDQRLRLIAGSLWDAWAQDPLGLTREQYEDDPRQADEAALTYDTRKAVDDWRTGLGYSGRWSPDSTWDLLAYADGRDVEIYQSIPKAVQASPARAGGMVDLQRDGYGAEARTTMRHARWSLSAGLQYQVTDEQRRGYENFIGDTLGVRGALRRDEDNLLDNFDQYLVAEYDVSALWTLSAAVRHSHVSFESDDHYITDGNPDDSGATDFDATLPALSLAFTPDAGHLLYFSAGAGFETPTFNELSYRSDGESGLNLALDAARSRSAEIGWKQSLARVFGGTGRGGLLSLAAFYIDSDDEIVPATNVDGRASFQNAATRRHGMELGLSLPLPLQLELQAAVDYLDARFSEDYGYVSRGETIVVPENNRVPGVARSGMFLELAWRRGRPGWAAIMESRYSDEVPVDDLNSDAADDYIVTHASVAYTWVGAAQRVELFVRVHNLFDERYAGSVIVNDGNGRYFEPAPERNVYAGISLQLG